MYRMSCHQRWNDEYAAVYHAAVCQISSRKQRAERKERGGNEISVDHFHTSRPLDTHTHTHLRLMVCFCDWWINTNSVTKLPSLRHFPTNRLNTLCSVDPPPPFTAYTLTSFVCVSFSISLSLTLFSSTSSVSPRLYIVSLH